MAVSLAKTYGTLALFLFLFLGVLALQSWYDGAKPALPPSAVSLPVGVLRSLDLGLHSALASFLWIHARSELILHRTAPQKFLDAFNTVTELDPRFSTPYAFATLVLPNGNYPDTITTALEIGKRGIEEADPDWHIPFSLAVTYHLYMKDAANAAKYFDIAAQTQGIPASIQQFAINYGVYPSEREQTKRVWIAIYESADDTASRARAAAYVAHFNILDYLENAVQKYHGKFGAYPEDINDLVNDGIISSIPSDPFGLQFYLYDNGIVGFGAATSTRQ